MAAGVPVSLWELTTVAEATHLGWVWGAPAGDYVGGCAGGGAGFRGGALVGIGLCALFVVAQCGGESAVL